MILKNLVISATLLSTLGMASFAHAGGFVVKCPKGNGTGDCVTVSNKSSKDWKELPVMCETDNSKSSWTVSINAGTDDLCLDVENHCKPDARHKIKMTINNGSTVKTCEWPVQGAL